VLADFIEQETADEIRPRVAVRRLLVRSRSDHGSLGQLQRALERALVLSEGPEIDPDALPEELRAAAAPSGPPPAPAEGDLSIKKAQRVLEADLIRRALLRTQGNRTRAAELLELSPRALLYKIREYGIGE